MPVAEGLSLYTDGRRRDSWPVGFVSLQVPHAPGGPPVAQSAACLQTQNRRVAFQVHSAAMAMRGGPLTFLRLRLHL